MAKSLVLDHVRVLTGNFRNFRGEVDKNYNRDGARYFSVAIDREALAMWRILKHETICNH